MKIFFLIAILFIISSCTDNGGSSTSDRVVLTEQSNNLKVGGIYLLKNKENTFHLTKILVLDDFAVHLRTYSDTFKTKPSNINSENLNILIGHFPVDVNGFLLDKPELLKVEDVKESELEGYKMYLEAMEE